MVGSEGASLFRKSQTTNATTSPCRKTNNALLLVLRDGLEIGTKILNLRFWCSHEACIRAVQPRQNITLTWKRNGVRAARKEGGGREVGLTDVGNFLIPLAQKRYSKKVQYYAQLYLHDCAA